MPPSASRRPVSRALLSVSDKTGLVAFAKGLAAAGVELVASGGTAAAIRDSGLTVLDVSELTQSPEMLGGRVKTLHPKVHGGILGRRDLESDAADMQANDIAAIDLVVVNLYPFEATVAKEGTTFAEGIEKIDIGGPSMLRSSAKNHEYVGVVCDPVDYATVLAEIEGEGGLAQATRQRLAHKAFQMTAAYDAAIQTWLGERLGERLGAPRPGEASGQDTDGGATFSERLEVSMPKADELRYGENPHQAAALYGEFLDIAAQLHGKALSFNNIVDVQAALALIKDFDPAQGAVIAILKHNTPCGVGIGGTPLQAYERAFETDPDSPFGGIIVSNVAFDLELADKVDEIFTEVLVAPGFSDDALTRLKAKKNRRLLRFDPARIPAAQLDVRGVYGGLLVQTPDGLADALTDELAGAQCVTKTKPSDEQQKALEFTWRVVKHVKSNAIVFGDAGRTLAVGGGATSRVDAVHNAVAKAGRVGLSLEGSVLASDAFFPFPDGLEAAVEAGARAVIQPGGSNRDELVIEAADRLGIPMLFTGRRHFRH